MEPSVHRAADLAKLANTGRVLNFARGIARPHSHTHTKPKSNAMTGTVLTTGTEAGSAYK
jgi:hypothetical protein